MKHILIGLFILSSTTLLAQDNRDNRHRNQNTNGNQHRDDRNTQVPENVQQSFQKDYPNAQNPEWNNTNGQWHGTYKDQNSRNVETYYYSNGQRIDTHLTYNQDELPSKVRNRANKRYHSNYNTYRIDRPNSQPIYQVRSQDGNTIYMDENGRKRIYRDRH